MKISSYFLLFIVYSINVSLAFISSEKLPGEETKGLIVSAKFQGKQDSEKQDKILGYCHDNNFTYTRKIRLFSYKIISPGSSSQSKYVEFHFQASPAKKTVKDKECKYLVIPSRSDGIFSGPLGSSVSFIDINFDKSMSVPELIKESLTFKGSKYYFGLKRLSTGKKQEIFFRAHGNDHSLFKTILSKNIKPPFLFIHYVGDINGDGLLDVIFEQDREGKGSLIKSYISSRNGKIIDYRLVNISWSGC